MGKKKKKKNKKKAEEGAESGDDAKKDEAASEAETGAEAAAPAGSEKELEGGEEGEKSEKDKKKDDKDDEHFDTSRDKKEKDSSPWFRAVSKMKKGGMIDSTAGRVPALHNYTLDLTCLTHAEEKTLRDVLEKDDGETRPIKEHVKLLRAEMDQIYKGFRKRPGDKPQCVHCRKKFGWWRYLFPLLYLGKRCQRCRHKTCKRCIHRQANGRYMCGMCVRLREIKHLTGDWMDPPATRLHSSDLIRVSLREKEKYKALHASREKKKKELLAKLNALNVSQIPAEAKEGGADRSSFSPVSGAQEKKKEKKDKKKKKKKNKGGEGDVAANNAIPSPDSVDINTSFLETARIAASVLEEERRFKARRQRVKKTSSSGSSTEDSSSDSEDSGESSGAGGGFSSGFESCEVGTAAKARGEIPREAADPIRESKNTGDKEACNGDFATLRDMAEGRRDLYRGGENFYYGAEDFKGKLPEQFNGGEKVRGRMGYFDLTQGRWVKDSNDYRMKMHQRAKERKSRIVKCGQDLILNKDQRVEQRDSSKSNVSKDNKEVNVGANFSHPKTDKDSLTKYVTGPQPQSNATVHGEARVKALPTELEQGHEKIGKQMRHKKPVVETNRSIYPSSSYVSAKERFRPHTEKTDRREEENVWASPRPSRCDRKKDSPMKSNRSSSRSGMVGVSRTVLEEERFKKKYAADKELTHHTFVVASPHIAADKDRHADLLRSKEDKKCVHFERGGSWESVEETRSPHNYPSEKADMYKTTKQHLLERQRRNRYGTFGRGNTSTPSPSQESPQTEQKRKLKARPVNEVGYTTVRNSRGKWKRGNQFEGSHRHFSRGKNATLEDDQGLHVPYEEPYDTTGEIDTVRTKGEFILSQANLALHNAAVEGTKPRAFGSRQPDYAQFNRSRRSSTSRARVTGIMTSVNHERVKSSRPPTMDDSVCRASVARFFSGQRNRSP